jgi:hypothetical protein
MKKLLFLFLIIGCANRHNAIMAVPVNTSLQVEYSNKNYTEDSFINDFIQQLKGKGWPQQKIILPKKHDYGINDKDTIYYLGDSYSPKRFNN